MLLNPIKTWFATILMVERLFKLKHAIEQTVVNPNWTTFVNSLCGNHHQILLTKVKVIQTNIRKDEFWDTFANFAHMVELVRILLKAFNGKQPCTGKAWLIMKTLKWNVLSLQDPPFELPLNLADVIEDQFYQRWKMLTTDLHYVKALFNPYLLGEACLHDDADVKENLNKVLWKTTRTLTTYALTLKDFTIFFESWGPFSNTLLVKDLDLFHMSGGILLDLVDAHLHPSPITFWCKCVPHHHVNKIGVHIHLFITKCEIG